MNRVAHLSYFREHDSGAGTHQKGRCVAHGWICGYAGESIASPTLQTNHQVGGPPGYAASSIELDQPLFRHLHNGRDHVTEAVMLFILQANDVGNTRQHGKTG